MEKTSCMICSKSMSAAGMKKHFFSSSHTQDLIDTMHRLKSYLQRWLADYQQKPGSVKYPKIWFGHDSNDYYNFCHICKSVRHRKCGRNHSCQHLKEISEFIKHNLEQKPSFDSLYETPVQSPEELDDILKKKIVSLEKQLTIARTIQAEQSDEIDGWRSFMEHVHDTDGTNGPTFDTVMDFFQKENKDLYEKILTDLGYGVGYSRKEKKKEQCLIDDGTSHFSDS